MNLVVVEDSYLNVKYKTGYSWLTENDGGDDDLPPNEEQPQMPAPRFQQLSSFINPGGYGGGGGGPPPGPGGFSPEKGDQAAA